MKAADFLPRLTESLSGRRVYSDAIERDGTVVIPAVQIRGGGGTNASRKGAENGGMGLEARPVGAFVIDDGRVSWKPALDFTRVVFRAQILVVAALVVAACVGSRFRKQLPPAG